MLKVVFVTSHPIQYQAPVFRELAAMESIDFEVLFAMIPAAEKQGDGFGVEFEWDIPLLEGYRYRVLDNVSAEPGVTTFSGCDTPGVGKVLRELRPDAVVVNGWVVKTCLQVLWACKAQGIPCLVRGEANDKRRRPAWKRWLQGFLVRQYSACLYIGTANRAFYRARRAKDDSLFSSPYCVDNSRFERSAAQLAGKRDAIRAAWHISPSAICFVFCGKFEYKKHPLELLSALHMAISNGTSLHLLMVGDGALRGACEQYSATHKLPVTFTGFLNQTEIIHAYVAADCLVLPSDAGETWGLVVNEAMACGRPALVSDQVGCAEDLVEPGVTGDVFSSGDWDGLTGLLSKYAGRPERLERMGTKASGRVRAYSPRAAADGIRKATIAIAGRRRQSTE